MARALSAELDAIYASPDRRRPAYLIEVWDIRSTYSTVDPWKVNDVVLQVVAASPVTPPAIVGPRDFTDDIVDVQVNEAAGEYVNLGVASSTINFTVLDPNDDYDPITNAAGDGRWLRQGNVVVLREGDAAVDSTLWPITFTGSIVGQAGKDRNRTDGRGQLTVKVSDRAADYFRDDLVSANFAQNTSYSDMANSVATVDMGLDVEEINLPSFGARTTCHLSTQFVDQNPLTSLAQIMFVDTFMPRFLGNGQLGLTNGIITKGPSRIYSDNELIISIVRPLIEENGPNVVRILGLDCDMDEIQQEQETLANVSISTGFFAQDTVIPVQWSDDGTQQARSPTMEVDVSINDGLFNVGSESFTAVTESDGGSVRGSIEVESGFALWLIATIAVSWVAAHKIPDIAPTTGGPTIPVGRLVEGTIGQIIMNTLSTQGRGEYRIVGLPYEYVYKEIVAEARTADVDNDLVLPQELEVENHLINSQADADTVAETVLRRERKRQNLRTVQMMYDLALEVDDVFEDADGNRYMITSIARQLVRNGKQEASVQCFEVTEGIRV